MRYRSYQTVLFSCGIDAVLRNWPATHGARLAFRNSTSTACLHLSVAASRIVCRRVMDFLYQSFQQDAILFLSLLHMKYDLAINHSAGSDPHSTIGADNKLLFVQTASSFYRFRFLFSIV